ncbi:MAG: transglycosylase domain-containing protein [Lachnospira sp.]|nr:transglycosylase domain-containing protein [Lachnospira sp.]
MKYGSNGITQKKKLLNSSTTKLGTKLGITSVKLLLICAVAAIVSGGCLALGAVQGIIASAPDISTIDVTPDGFVSVIYDDKGNEIQKLSTSGSNRISVGIEQVPIDLQEAFIALEDSRFYEHNGIDIKGIMRAAAVAIKSGSLSQGGSTLTQQLIKNNVFQAYNETTVEKIKRKLQEQYLAVKLETVMDKEEILENYLNTINLGNGYYGVQAAANGYFGKDVSELTLSECAVIASITQSPAYLNPVKYPENNKERQTKVLDDMLEQGYISQEEHDAALADDVYARIQSLDLELADDESYTYFVDTIIEQIINDLMEQKGYSETQASDLVYRGGLQIYSTQNTSMQAAADAVINNPKNYPMGTFMSVSSYNLTIREADKTISYYSHYKVLEYYQKKNNNPDFTLTFKTEEAAKKCLDTFRNAMLAKGGTVVNENVSYTIQPQASFSVIENSTGHVKVLTGGRGDKTGKRTLNRATDSKRQPGSAIKPMAVYGPALDNGSITLATTIDDAPYYYSGEKGKLVSNVDKGVYSGLLSVREALMYSTNVPAVKTLTKITPEVGFNYASKFGLTTLISPKESVNGNHDMVQALALGGLTYGVYNIDMTAAYATIANSGVYTKPVYYTTVVDFDGNIILDNTTPETQTVLKDTTAWLVTDLLKTCTTYSYSKNAVVKDIDTCGKTGTTSGGTDRWFCGFTPYYSASIWVGFDDNSGDMSSMNQPKMWGDIMRAIHADLAPKTFEQPAGIIPLQVCKQSGKLHVEGLCDTDPRGSQVVTEYFSYDNMPTETCDTHIQVKICKTTGEVASTNCLDYDTVTYIKKAELLEALNSKGEQIVPKDQKYAITETQLSTICSVHGNTNNSGENDTSADTENESSSPSDNGGTRGNTVPTAPYTVPPTSNKDD